MFAQYHFCRKGQQWTVLISHMNCVCCKVFQLIYKRDCFLLSFSVEMVLSELRRVSRICLVSPTLFRPATGPKIYQSRYRGSFSKSFSSINLNPRPLHISAFYVYKHVQKCAYITSLSAILDAICKTEVPRLQGLMGNQRGIMRAAGWIVHIPKYTGRAGNWDKYEYTMRRPIARFFLTCCFGALRVK